MMNDSTDLNVENYTEEDLLALLDISERFILNLTGKLHLIPSPIMFCILQLLIDMSEVSTPKSISVFPALSSNKN